MQLKPSRLFQANSKQVFDLSEFDFKMQRWLSSTEDYAVFQRSYSDGSNKAEGMAKKNVS